MKHTNIVRGRRKLGGVLLAAVLAAPLVFGASTGASAQEFKIGVLAPYSGPAGYYGPIYENAAKLAVEKINSEGGILGMPIKLIIEDTKFAAPTAVEAARKLTTRERVSAIIGTVSGIATSAVIPVIERAKTPFITTVEGIVEQCSEYVFGLGPTPEQKLLKWVPWIIETQGAKTFYFVGNDYFYPRAMAEFATKLIVENGGTVIGAEYAPLGTSEWATILTRAEAARPDAFFNLAVGAGSSTMTKQAQQFGFTEKTQWTVMPGNSSAYMPFIHEFSQGGYGVEVYSEKLDNAANREFVRLHRAKYPSEFPITEVGAAVYTAFFVIKAAAEKAQSTDGAKINAAIGGLTLDAPQGTISIDPETHLTVYNVYLVQIEGKQLNIVQDFGRVVSPRDCG